MTHALRPLKLYLANRYYVLGVPLSIYAVVVVLSIAVVAIIGSMTGFPLSEEISPSPSAQPAAASGPGPPWASP